MSNTQKKKWFKPLFEFDEPKLPKKMKKDITKTSRNIICDEHEHVKVIDTGNKVMNINHKNWMKNFDPKKVEELAVNSKKVQEVDEWFKNVCVSNNSDMLLLTGPVGCGKTATVRILATKYNMKLTEWITPLDIDIPTEYGDFEYREKQSKKFLDFIINAANFTSLLDNNYVKLVLVEDFPNTFMKTPTEFTDVLNQYRQRAKSPIIFICSESHMDSKSTAVNLFTPCLKEQFQIHHVAFNSATATCLKAALKRVAEIISERHTSMYITPTAEMIDCVVNSSTGDIRSAVLNLHFACLKGPTQNLETSVMIDKEKKSKSTKTFKKKQVSNKFSTLGKDQTVSILHGVGRVLNPKIGENGQLTHAPMETIDQFISQPNSFVNFLEENYLSHYSSIDYASKAASALSDADYMLAEWREKIFQEYGLYTAIAGLMLSNKSPVSAWNPVRGPKNMRVQYPTLHEIPLLEQENLYKGKILVSDYQTYCKIIAHI